MGFLVQLAIGLGLMFCAETLSLLGNAMGWAGLWFPLFILAAAGIHLFGVAKVYEYMPESQKEHLLIFRSFPRFVALTSPLASRFIVAVTIATGLMATAGFVFNEVFLYLFPNFLFAFILLGIIVIINLIV